MEQWEKDRKGKVYADAPDSFWMRRINPYGEVASACDGSPIDDTWESRARITRNRTDAYERSTRRSAKLHREVRDLLCCL